MKQDMDPQLLAHVSIKENASFGSCQTHPRTAGLPCLQLGFGSTWYPFKRTTKGAPPAKKKNLRRARASALDSARARSPSFGARKEDEPGGPVVSSSRVSLLGPSKSFRRTSAHVVVSRFFLFSWLFIVFCSFFFKILLFLVFPPPFLFPGRPEPSICPDLQ